MALKWIKDDFLIDAVKHLLSKAQEAKISADSKFGKNVIDPFSALFEITGFDIKFQDWRKNETARQAQKTLQNHIGDFHQKILGSVDGWEDLHVGNVIDLFSKKRKIIAEVKNKYNTVKGSDLVGLYKQLENSVMDKHSVYKDHTAYYVAIIPKKPGRYEKEFTPSDNKKGSKCQSNEKIRQIDGASFYSLVTGHSNALEELFDYLPDLMEKYIGKSILSSDKDRLKEFFKKAFD